MNKNLAKNVNLFHLQAARDISYDSNILQVFFQCKDPNPCLNTAIYKLVSKFVEKTCIYEESSVYAASIRYIDRYFTVLLSNYCPVKILNFQKLPLEEIAKVAKLLNSNIIKTYQICSTVRNILFKMYYAVIYLNKHQLSQKNPIKYGTYPSCESIPNFNNQEVDKFYSYFQKQDVDCQAIRNSIVLKENPDRVAIKPNFIERRRKGEIRASTVFKIQRRQISDIKIDINSHQYAKEKVYPIQPSQRDQNIPNISFKKKANQERLLNFNYADYEKYCSKVTFGLIVAMLQNPMINSKDKVAKLDKYINFEQFTRNFSSEKEEEIKQMVQKFTVLMNAQIAQVFRDYITKLKNKQIVFKLIEQIQFGQKCIHKVSKVSADLEQNLDPSMLFNSYHANKKNQFQNKVLDIMEKRNRVSSLPQNLKQDLRGIINSNLGQKKMDARSVLYPIQPNKSIYKKNQPSRLRIKTLPISKILNV